VEDIPKRKMYTQAYIYIYKGVFAIMGNYLRGLLGEERGEKGMIKSE
jgi:hypothetical protein